MVLNLTSVGGGRALGSPGRDLACLDVVQGFL